MSSMICPRYAKFSTLLHNIGGKTLRKAIEHVCLQSIPNFETFLNNKIHDIFHLWKSKCCCTVQSLSYQPMTNIQWNSLYEKESKASRLHHPIKGLCPCRFKAIPNISISTLDVTAACLIIKNVCPGPLGQLTDIDVIRNMKSTFISHTIYAELKEDEFNDKWRQVKSALCNIALAISQEFHDVIVNEIDKLYKDDPLRWTVIENTRLLIEDHIRDVTFQTTSIVEKGLDILTSKGIVIYSGFSGCGKTKVAMETMLKARDFDIPNTDVNLIYLEQLENLSTIIDPWKQNIVLFEDCFGKSAVTRGTLEDKMSAINIIYCLVKTGRTKAIFTLRTKILKDCVARLRKTKLFQENFENIILDLNCSDLKYTMEDKRRILEKHLLGRNVKITLTKTQMKDVDWENTGWIDQFSVDSISRIERPDFPLQCRLFCSQLKNLKRGENYFRRPQGSRIEDLDEMKRSDYLVDRFRYCILAYACLKDGVFDMSNLDGSLLITLQQNVMHSVLPDTETSSEIYNALRNLTHTYLQKRVEKGSVWSFWHNSILEAVAVSAGECFPELVIAHCNSIVLLELLVPDDFKGSEEEFVITVLPDKYENVCQRFLLEMRNEPKSISSLLRHRLLENKKFNDFLMSYLESTLKYFSQDELLENEIERERENSLIREIYLVACRIDHSDVVSAILKLGLPQMLIDKGFRDSCYFNCPSVAGVLKSHCTNFTESFHQACSFGSECAFRKIYLDMHSCFLSVGMPANDEMFSELLKAEDLPEEFLTAFSKTRHLLSVIINIQADLNPFPYRRNHIFTSFVGSIIKCIQENQCPSARKHVEQFLHSSSPNMLSVLAFSVVNKYIDREKQPYIKFEGLENEEYLLFYDSLRDAVAFLRSNESNLEHTCSSAFGKQVGLCSDQELRDVCLACVTCNTIQLIFRQVYSYDEVSLPNTLKNIFQENKTFCTKSVVDYMKWLVKFAIDNVLELRQMDENEKRAYQTLLTWTVWGYPVSYVLEIDKATERTRYCKYKDKDALFLPFKALEEGLYRSCKAGHEKITTSLIQLLLQRHKYSFECQKVLRRAIRDTIYVGKYDFAAKITKEHREHLSDDDISTICYHFVSENQLEKADMIKNLKD